MLSGEQNMGLLSHIARSWKKSKRLRALQLKIAPPGETVDDLVTDFLKGSDERDKAMEEFLDLCMADAAVASVMKEYNLSRDSLSDLYQYLAAAGLGQWVNRLRAG
jgi:hypothetical protein